MNPIRLTSLARAGLLVGFGVLIARLLTTGQMRYYMSPSFDGLTAATGALMLLLGVLEFRRAFASTTSPPAGHGELDAALSLALVAVPLVVGLTLSPRSLGASSLDGTPVSSLVLTFDADPPSSAPAPAPTRPIADIGDLLRYLRTVGERGVGQPVHARGLVARSQDLPANQFVLVRFAIVHCVADAQPLGFLVELPAESSFSSDQWVELDGTLDSGPRGDERLVAIKVQRIVASEEPAEPYVPAF